MSVEDFLNQVVGKSTEELVASETKIVKSPSLADMNKLIMFGYSRGMELIWDIYSIKNQLYMVHFQHSERIERVYKKAPLEDIKSILESIDA